MIAAPWHILIARANPTQGDPGNLAFTHGHWSVPLPTDGNIHGWLWFYFVNEHLLRYLNLRVPRDYDTVPLALFWALLLIWLMPWSGFLFKALPPFPGANPSAPASPSHPHPGREHPPPPRHLGRRPAHLLQLLHPAGVLRPPRSAPLILLIAAWLNDDAAEAESFTVPSPLTRAGQRISVVLLAIGSLAALAAGFLALHAQPPAPTPTSPRSSAKTPPPTPSPSDTSSTSTLRPWAPFAPAPPHRHRALRRRPRQLAPPPRLATPPRQPLARRRHLRFPHRRPPRPADLLPLLTSQQLAAAIAPQLKPDDLIVIHGEYEAASTLGFYLHRPGAGAEPLHILNGRSSNLWYGSFFPDAPPIFEDDTSLSLQWNGSHRIYLWQDLSDPVPSLPTKPYFITQSGGKEILSNQPNPY